MQLKKLPIGIQTFREVGYLIGVEFSRDSRSVEGFATQTLQSGCA
ncbi:hypothetical protein [Pseudomonas sp. AN-1]|nr:hypothetical protein [Pseudomonas sp. AN-1]WPP47401.1 hypothetical protein SK095_08535 [Pseudomonas sp. AN-1]